MKKLKKVILAVTAISSITVVSAMANQDVAGKLENWYQNKLTESQQSASDQFIHYAQSLQPGLEAEKNKLISDAKSRVETAALRETNRAVAQIHHYNGQYLGQMWTKQEQLIGGQIEQDFDFYVEAKNAEVTAYLNNQADLFFAEIEKALDEETNETK